MPKLSVWALAMLPLTGCVAAVPQPEIVASGVPDAERALRKSMSEVTQALSTISSPALASNPDPVPADSRVGSAGTGLERVVAAGDSGSLDAVARNVAERVGYSVKVLRTAATPDVTVSLPTQPAPAVDLFRALGEQAGSAADVIVNPAQRRVVVKYRA